MVLVQGPVKCGITQPTITFETFQNRLPPLCNFGAFHRVKNNYFEFVVIKILVGFDHLYQTPYGYYTSLTVGLPQPVQTKILKSNKATNFFKK